MVVRVLSAVGALVRRQQALILLIAIVGTVWFDGWAESLRAAVEIRHCCPAVLVPGTRSAGSSLPLDRFAYPDPADLASDQD